MNMAGCPWCGRGVESTFHLLIGCRFAVFFWQKIFLWWKRHWQFPLDFVTFFNECFDAPVTGNTKCTWMISISSGLWTLWNARNSFIFENKKSSLSDLIFYTKLRALFWSKSNPSLVGIDESVWWLDPAKSMETDEQSHTAVPCALDGQAQFLGGCLSGGANKKGQQPFGLVVAEDCRTEEAGWVILL
ncbi:hypothetical protein V6N13_033311 [Hibiscus sabdariffa]